MKKTMLIAAALFGAAGTLFGAAEMEKYTTVGYVMGGADNMVRRDARPEATGTAQLAFAGATLTEIKDSLFAGWVTGINYPAVCHSYFTHTYYDANNVLQFLVVTPQKLDKKSDTDSYIKGVSVKLTQGADGVYVQKINGPYFTTTDANLVATTDFIAVDGNGNISLQNNTGALGYALRGLSVLKVVPVAPSTPELFFANPPGGSTLTVDDIKNYRFSGIIIGPSVDHALTRHDIENKYIINGTDGKAERIRLELQVMDDRYLKAAFVELTNGADGVYAQTIGAAYYTVATSGATLGTAFLEPDGSFDNSTIAAKGATKSGGATLLAGNYGAASLCCEYTSARSYTLDSTKTWSQLTGSSAPVSDEALDITINVTADAPTLTFDVPVTAHSLVVRSEVGTSVTFAVDDPSSKPSFGTWDFRRTTNRTVIFKDFMPATTSAAANLLPDATAPFVFDVDGNGIFPFNNTPVVLPCASVRMLGDQTFPTGLAFSKINELPLTGSVTFGGNVSGTGVITLPEDGVITVTGPVTVANTVTITNELNAAISIAASGDTASFAMNGNGTVGGFVLTEGTLHVNALAANEDDVLIGNGGTLAIKVTDLMKRAGYTSRATVLEGGVIRFYDADGVELGVGRPQMTVLPGTDALWSPDGASGDLDEGSRWNTGSVPAENSDVAMTDAGNPGATAVINTYQTYGQVTIQEGSDVVFTQAPDSPATFTATTLNVSPNSAATITLPSFVCANVTVGDNAELRILGPEEEVQTFAATVSGTGKVIYLGGTVMPTANSSYTGGTVIKNGALARAGNNNGVFGNKNNRITIEAGGALDTNGTFDLNYYLTTDGDGVPLEDGTMSGAVFNTKAGSQSDSNKAQYRSLTLSGPSTTLRADNIWGFVAMSHNSDIAVALGTNTLVKTGTNSLIMTTRKSIQVSGTGTIDIADGTLLWDMKSGGGAADAFAASNAVLRVESNGVFDVRGNVGFGSVANDGLIKLNMASRNADLTFSGAYSGDGKVDVDGYGKSAYMRFSSFAKSEVTVHAGRLASWGKHGNNVNYKFISEEEPNANFKIVVEPGAQYDINGAIDFNASVVIAGSLANGKGYANGAFANRSETGVGDGSGQVTQLVLAGDAQVGGATATSNFGLLAPSYAETRLDLGPYTMDLYTAANFWLINTTITGTGKLSVRGGTLRFCKKAMRGVDWTLETLADGKVNFDGVNVTCSNLVWRGTVAGNGKVTAYGKYKPMSEDLPAVTLSGPGAGIDVSEMTEPWDIATSRGLSFAAGTSVCVDLGEREPEANLKLLSWTSAPANVTWTMTPESSRFHVKDRADGLYIIPRNFIIYLR